MKTSVILSLALNDLKSRYAGSLLGSLWAFIGTFMTVCIYWFVYTFALNGGEVEGFPYIVWLLTGIIPWFFFAEAFTGTATCYVDYSFLVKKVKFKAELLPLIRVLSGFFTHILFLGIIYILITCLGVLPKAGQFNVLIWIIGGFLFCLGLGKIISLLCVRFKDVKYAAGVIVQLGFWITPVFWNSADLPDNIRWVADYNPVAILIEGYRNALLFGESVADFNFIIFWISVIILNIAGYLLTKKFRPVIADFL